MRPGPLDEADMAAAEKIITGLEQAAAHARGEIEASEHRLPLSREELRRLMREGFGGH